MIRRLIPAIIIIGGGIIIPPMAAYAFAGWPGVAALYAAGLAWLAYLAWGAPILDELFPPEDRLPARCPEARPVEGVGRSQSEITATATHKGER